jgi:DNA-binding MarR family transcriptional regulator
LPIGRLATAEQVSPAAITKAVAALEAAGLAERVRSDEDRRVVLVRATAAGVTPHRQAAVVSTLESGHADFHRHSTLGTESSSVRVHGMAATCVS